MMRLLTLVIPYNPHWKGARFIEDYNGSPHATPMLAALVVVELSDLLFAVDSIPCILGLTHDLFLVFSSNMFAVLGLRSLYLLLADWFPLSQGFSVFIIFSIVGLTVVKSFVDSNNPRNKKKGGLLPSFSSAAHHSV